ncbi:hypothetical protein J2Z53_000734 [Clostridium moniliforme]|uniref:Lipoprotein n=1 Tax=Clostridium moniliforme TaxID=39489 RepID=A0ABS4EYT3_9CLOT|nr:hypothetical protein [Clostridium moniliforme]MBP1889153.1 hypothetical protein [Clostridium moniliforme]
MKKIGIVLISIFTILSLTLMGCGSKDLSLGTLIKDLQKGNVEEAKNLLIKSDTNDEFKLYNSNLSKDLLKEYYKNVTFKVVKMNKESKSATAKVKFEYPNMKTLGEDAFKDTFNGKEIASVKDSSNTIIKNITEKLSKGSFNKENKEIDINFEKGTDNWLIKNNADLNDILCTQLNYITVLTEGSNFTMESVTALKNLDVDWFSKHNQTFNHKSISDINKVKPYLTKISSKDKIKFNSCSIDGDKLNVNVTVSTPNMPKLLSDNYADINTKYANTPLEAQTEENAAKILTDYLSTSKFEMLENKFDIGTVYKPDDNKIELAKDTISGDTIANYMFGDMDNLGM